MTYYYPPGTVLPPQAALNDKPGIYGAYNGAAIPVSLGAAAAFHPPVQLVQQPATLPSGLPTQPGLMSHGGLPPGLSHAGQPPPSSPGMPQPQTGPPQIGLPAGAAPFTTVSTAGFGSAVPHQQQPQPSPYMAAASAAGLYQGANLAYPQHSVSPVPITGNTFVAGHNVPGLYTVSRMPTPPQQQHPQHLPPAGASTYPAGTGPGFTVTSVPLVYPASAAAAPGIYSAPRQAFPGEGIPSGLPSHLMPSQIPPHQQAAMSAYAGQPAPQPSYPGQGGMPLMASPPYPAGAAPFQRSVP